MFAELSEDDKRIEVHFRYSKQVKDAVKSIPGSKFVPPDKGGPHWTLPKEMTSARLLRELLDVEWGEAILAWGREAQKIDRNLRTLAMRDDVPVEELILNEKLPKLAQWLRPYQRADVKFLATTNALNLLEPRLGKTTETIGAIYEAGLEQGRHLVVTPSTTSIEDVWEYEFNRWTDLPVFRWSGQETKKYRQDVLHQIADNPEDPFVLVTTPNMVRSGLEWSLDYEWNSFTIDEFHKTGLAETFKNQFPKAALQYVVVRKWGLSGTPMGGKPIKLWGGMHWLVPDAFPAKWRWAEQWLDVHKEKRVVGRTPDGRPIIREVREVGGVRKDKEDDFYKHTQPYMVRRLRSEVLPQLPEKQWVDVWCRMTPKQAKQYNKFADDTEIRIDEHYLTATSILAEYTRLKQFADSYCEVSEYDPETGKVKLRATPESGKLAPLMARLAEAGIDPEEPTGEAQAIVASQHKEMADMLFDYLSEQGIKCAKITGDVNKKGERARIVKQFKKLGESEGMRVLVMTTDAGGVALTMDAVESVHVMDEKWNPDDQEQLADRAINTSDLHQVTVFVYRSLGTVEEYIRQEGITKSVTNKTVLDRIRQAHKRRKEAA